MSTSSISFSSQDDEEPRMVVAFGRDRAVSGSENENQALNDGFTFDHGPWNWELVPVRNIDLVVCGSGYTLAYSSTGISSSESKSASSSQSLRRGVLEEIFIYRNLCKT